jgi:hypothetical protein
VSVYKVLDFSIFVRVAFVNKKPEYISRSFFLIGMS